MTPEECFWSKVKGGGISPYAPHLGPCQEWTAGLSCGYGRYNPKGFGTSLAHRIAWLLSGRKLTPGMQLDHLCHNRRCVNVDHLEEVTAAENRRRTPAGVQRNAHPAIKRLTCIRGHMWSEETTRLNPKGHRSCRICDLEDKQARSEKRRQRRIQEWGFDPGPRYREYINKGRKLSKIG